MITYADFLATTVVAVDKYLHWATTPQGHEYWKNIQLTLEDAAVGSLLANDDPPPSMHLPRHMSAFNVLKSMLIDALPGREDVLEELERIPEPSRNMAQVDVQECYQPAIHLVRAENVRLDRDPIFRNLAASSCLVGFEGE